MSIAALHNAKRAAVKAQILEGLRPQMMEIETLTEECARTLAYLQNTCVTGEARLSAEVKYDHDSKQLLFRLGLLKISGIALAHGTFEA